MFIPLADSLDKFLNLLSLTITHNITYRALCNDNSINAVISPFNLLFVQFTFLSCVGIYIMSPCHNVTHCHLFGAISDIGVISDIKNILSFTFISVKFVFNLVYRPKKSFILIYQAPNLAHIIIYLP